MLELLQAAAQVGQQSESVALPENTLTFVIQYANQPDLDTERARIEDLLGGGGFDLVPYSVEDDPELLILQFTGVPREQSPDFLFAAANDLNEALGTVSVTPDIGAIYSDLGTPAPDTEGIIGNIFWGMCQSNAGSPADSEWARKNIRVDRAEAQHGVSGAGILIGQPDTGVAIHSELGSGLDMATGTNIIDGTGDPTDPLSKDMKSPGHGTGTSSAVISRPGSRVTGTAIGATLVPVRVVNSVVIGDGFRVAKGIDHARRNGCRIVTMSLGGPFTGPSLARGIVRAVKADMIVLAAAGNCVRVVTYPGYDRNIIAVAGVDHRGKRWKGSCRGRAVDIAAPGENVHVARRVVVMPGHNPSQSEKADVNSRGQGTSFAVALTAGVAALWLERFGFDAIKTEARRRGMFVQFLFRHALQSTAQKPAGWNSRQMGAGIVDAEKLLNTALRDLPGDPIPLESSNPALARFDSEFEGEQIAAEASFVAFDWSLREDPDRASTLENSIVPLPSALLADRIDTTLPVGLATPAAIGAPATPPVPLEEAVKRLAVSHGPGLEAANTVDTENALETIRATGSETILEQIDTALANRRAAHPDLVNPDLQAEAMNKIRDTLDSLTNEQDDPGISLAERRITLEALVKLSGRPAIRVNADGSEVTDPQLGDWRAKLVPTRHKWRPLTDAVGRIDVQLQDGSWVHAGTGFVVGDGQIMTNRHVLDTFAEPLPAPAEEQKFVMRRKASIIFDPQATDETTRYEITDVVTAGSQRIGGFVSLDKLDMAVVNFAVDNSHDAPPTALSLSTQSTTDIDLTDILVAGYPAEPRGSHGPDSADAEFLSFWDRIAELYGEEYGVKYMSPGKVLERPGEVFDDNKSWVFTHDATTLAGNSGSGIISLHGEMRFCGLHFGGSTLTQNFAHDVVQVFAQGDGVFDPALVGG